MKSLQKFMENVYAKKYASISNIFVIKHISCNCALFVFKYLHIIHQDGSDV